MEEPEYEYQILGKYGSEWEIVTIESTRSDAKRMLRDYDENEPMYPHKIRKVRV